MYADIILNNSKMSRILYKRTEWKKNNRLCTLWNIVYFIKFLHESYLLGPGYFRDNRSLLKDDLSIMANQRKPKANKNFFSICVCGYIKLYITLITSFDLINFDQTLVITTRDDGKWRADCAFKAKIYGDFPSFRESEISLFIHSPSYFSDIRLK